MKVCLLRRHPMPSACSARGPFATMARSVTFLLVLLATRWAAAQAPVPTILIVDTLLEGIDAEAMRAAVSRELGVVAVPPSDPRAAVASGIIRVRVDPTKGELSVEYEERPRTILRSVPIPNNRDAVIKSAAALAGNLARNGATDLTWARRQSAPLPQEPSSSPQAAPQIKRLWFGASAEMDGMSLPSESNNNVCFLDRGYYCTNVDGSELSPTTPGFLSTDGGFGIKNGRILISGDYAITDNWMVGARAGFVAQRYPGSKAPHQSFAMGHAHFELRGMYAFGDRALAEGVAPYAMLAIGAAQFDAKEDLQNPNQPTRQAWKVYGPLFTSFGFGVRWAISSEVGVMATPAKLTFVFPYETTIAWSPELGVQFGF
jgi:hypothetical protein